ncbi:hypothetical protein [Aeropyrum camini]|uniref:Uncharacterized protein n=1 Tax=Aeropyrum camini SY1 = JCM 12091 TaxID=1198449 RepID=U3TEG7_9CREN|nr:hypothetical protein [Aeropyrum camini]BAN89714.1 hypothetical protein ACAM_0245 [Aeropyrum camini SY1 = JCM 12091]
MSSERQLMRREEVLEWIRARIRDLEEEISYYKTILAIVEKGSVSASLPGEKVEEVKVGRRRVARLYKGETHVRIVMEWPMALPEEIEAYLRSVEEELRAVQARTGDIAGEDLATLTIRRLPDGTVEEIVFKGLYTTVEHLKARSALKYAAESMYHINRAMEREEA